MDKIRVGCAVVAVQEGRVILGQRGKQPFFGKWVLPGGGVELYEHFSDTAKREFKEETGLDIIIGSIIQVEEIIDIPAEHRIVIFVEAAVVGGQQSASSDLLDVRAFSRNEVAGLAMLGELTPTVQKVLVETGWISAESSPVFATKQIKTNRDRRKKTREARRALEHMRKYRALGGYQLRFQDI